MGFISITLIITVATVRAGEIVIGFDEAPVLEFIGNDVGVFCMRPRWFVKMRKSC